jgi:hypothetical protein
MLQKFRKMLSASTPHLPLIVSVFALLVSGATYFNTLSDQGREFAHKQLLIQPSLSFVADRDEGTSTYQSSLSLRNDGLGPAIIQEVVFETEGRCISSSNFKKLEDWNEVYKAKMLPQFGSALKRDVSFKSSSVNSVDFNRPEVQKMIETLKKSRPAKSRKDNASNVTDEYEAYEIYGTDTFGFTVSTLGPGATIPTGSSLLLAEMKVETSVTKVQQAAVGQVPGGAVRPKINESSQQAHLIEPFDALKIGIGYCSFSGLFCAFAVHGNSKCFDSTVLDTP